MFYPKAVLSLLSLTTLLPLATPLGINCRGSGLCPLATWSDKSSEHITQVLRDAVWESPKPNSTVYNSGDHIICVSSSLAVTLGGSAGPSVDSDVGVKASATGSFSLAGSIGLGGICLFPQGANLTLGQIRPLLDAVLEHGCKTCGSVPIHFVDEGSNNPDDGILTFNYVGNPDCVGECISAKGSTNSTTQPSSSQASTSQARLKRSAKVGARIEE